MQAQGWQAVQPPQAARNACGCLADQTDFAQAFFERNTYFASFLCMAHFLEDVLKVTPGLRAEFAGRTFESVSPGICRYLPIEPVNAFLGSQGSLGCQEVVSESIEANSLAPSTRVIVKGTHAGAAEGCIIKRGDQSCHVQNTLDMGVLSNKCFSVLSFVLPFEMSFFEAELSCDTGP